MCGVTGCWDFRAGASSDTLQRLASAMSDTLTARGPDDFGVWVDSAAGIALGFRRLAIVDLSPTGHQPMISADGRYAMVYNGEIYNHVELRQQLSEIGAQFRGTSDTEVLIEAFDLWGITATLQRLNGMFAIALWDRTDRRLHLMRDRVGIKPLYWAQFGRQFLFGSELKALHAHPAFNVEIDRSAMAAFLRVGYVPGPHSIFRNVQKLQPGMHLSVGSDGRKQIEPYWNLKNVALEGRSTRPEISDGDAIDHLEALLKDAVGRQMVADVPLGAFLSGGVDSSTVVALMQAQSNRPVQTFTIGFREADFDEADAAREVATHLGTAHTEVEVTADDARALVPRMANCFDEPFADSSQLPSYLLSQMTRASVTVALSGDGGDELFAGYNRYEVAASIRRRFESIPRPIRGAASAGLRAMAQPSLNALFAKVPGAHGLKLSSSRLIKLANGLDGQDGDAIFREIMSLWSDPRMLMPGVAEAPHSVIDDRLAVAVPDFRERMRVIDMDGYLPDDILTKVDRTSMAVSLEARVPLLDHRVIEHAWRLPKHMLVRDGVTKWVLKQVLYRHVPRALVDRPKKGFSVPIQSWLKGPLREWAEDLISERELKAAGLEPGPVRRRWQQHVSGMENWHNSLWAVLMLQAWRRQWIQI